MFLPGTEKILEQMGEQICLARLRRDLGTELVAERAGISRATLNNVEKDDELGRKLQDLKLTSRRRASKVKADE